MEEIKKVITIETKKSINGLTSLRKEIKELKGELLGLEEGSKEYNEVLTKLANKTRDLTDLNEAVRFSAQDLGQRLSNLAKVGTGIVSGFSAMQGAAALFGKESEALEKTMIKLQAGIAIVQGLEGIEGLTKSIPALIANFRGIGDAIDKWIGNAINKLDPFNNRLRETANRLAEISSTNLSDINLPGGQVTTTTSSSTGGNVTNINNQQLQDAQKTIVPLNKQYDVLLEKQKASLNNLKQQKVELQNTLNADKARIDELNKWNTGMTKLVEVSSKGNFQEAQKIFTDMFGDSVDDAQQLYNKMAEIQNLAKDSNNLKSAISKNEAELKGLNSQIAKTEAQINKTDAAIKQLSKTTSGFGKAAKSVVSTVGWTLLITAIITAIYKLFDWIKATRDAAREQKLFNEEIIKTSSNIAGSSLGAFNELAEAYKRVGDSAESKKKFLNDYKEQIDKTGLAINDINDLEEAFVNNTNKYVNAIIARAEIDAYRESITEKTKENLEQVRLIEEDIENIKNSSNNASGQLAYGGLMTGPGQTSQQQNIDALIKGKENEIKSLNEEYNTFVDDVEQKIFDLTNKYSGLWKTNEKGSSTSTTTVKNNIKDELAALRNFIRESELLLMSDKDRELAIVEDKYAQMLSLASDNGMDLTTLEEAKAKEISAILQKYRDKDLEDQKKADEERLKQAEEGWNKFQAELKRIRIINSTSNLQEPQEQKYQTNYRTNFSKIFGLYGDYKSNTEDGSSDNRWQSTYQTKDDLINQYNEQIKYNEDFYNLTKSRIERENDLLNEQLLNEQLNAEQRQEIQTTLKENEMALSDAALAKETANTEAYNKLQTSRQQALTATMSVASSLSGSLANVFQTEMNLAEEGSKEQKQYAAAYKAFAVTQAVIDTFSAANAAYASMSSIPIVGPGLGIAAAAAAIASGIANVRQILKADSSGSVSASTPSETSVTPPNINLNPVEYTRNILGDKETDALNQPTKVYVTEQDISDVQNKVKVTESNASF